MNKKLIITETQYNRLQKLLIETPFNQMVDNKIKVGDEINIKWDGGENNFKVINEINGQVIMDCIDKNYTDFRFLVFHTSLNNDRLELRRVNKVTDSDKLNNPKSWPKINLKGISNIEIKRNGNIVDSLNKSEDDQQQPNTSDTQNDDNQKMDNFLSLVLDELNTDKGLMLKLNNAEIIFCCNNRSGDIFTLEIKDNKSLNSLDKWDTLILTIRNTDDLLKNNKSIIRTTNLGKTFGLKFKANSGTESSDIWLDGIEDFKILNSCDNNNNEENEDDLSNLDPMEVAKIIASDKNLQRAFYSQPSFWALLKAELNGDKALGKGIITAAKMVRDYKDKTIDEKLGAKFITNQKVLYRLLDYPVDIIYPDKKGIPTTFERKVGVDYYSTVKSYSFDEKNLDYKVLENSEEKSKLLIKEPTDKPNIFLCDIIKEYIINDEVKTKKENDIRIKLFDSNGYKANKTK